MTTIKRKYVKFAYYIDSFNVRGKSCIQFYRLYGHYDDEGLINKTEFCFEAWKKLYARTLYNGNQQRSEV